MPVSGPLARGSIVERGVLASASMVSAPTRERVGVQAIVTAR
jgi:hypothetical protein